MLHSGRAFACSLRFRKGQPGSFHVTVGKPELTHFERSGSAKDVDGGSIVVENCFDLTRQGEDATYRIQDRLQRAEGVSNAQCHISGMLRISRSRFVRVQLPNEKVCEGRQKTWEPASQNSHLLVKINKLIRNRKGSSGGDIDVE